MNIRRNTLEATMSSLPALTRAIEAAVHVEGHEPGTVARALRLPMAEVSRHLAAAREARAGAIARFETGPDPVDDPDGEEPGQGAFQFGRLDRSVRRNGPNTRKFRAP